MDINEVILAAGIDAKWIEDDSIPECDHFYIYFDNGLVLSILRGSHPTGRVLGDPSTGDVEAAVLKLTLGGLMPFKSKDEGTLRKNLNADALTAFIKETGEHEPLSLEEVFNFS